MASISHLAAGALCGALYARETNSRALPSVAVFAILALAPDLDLLWFEAGLNNTPLGHRAATHSLSVSLGVGALVGTVSVRPHNRKAARIYCVLALLSHAILDAMTLSGPGPQLLWPFSSAPITTAWQPIPGTHSYLVYFTTDAIPILAIEALWCVPFISMALWVLFRNRDRVLPAGAPVHDND